MATALSVENRKLRRRVEELEGEVSFLQDQNYHIQRVSDAYRERVLQYIEALRSKACGGASPAFATAEDLEELLRRLRSQDITHSPSRPRVEEAAATVSPAGLATREGDDGLMHSTSSLSRATQEREEAMHGFNHADGRRSQECPSKRQKPHGNESAAAKNAQRATVVKLATENKKLASLVDTLRLRVAAAGRLNASLEKKYRALSSLMGRSHLSGSGRQQGVAGDETLSSPQLRKELRNLREENEKLRTNKDHSSDLCREVSHYKTLLSRQTKEVEFLRQRESKSLEEMNDVKGRLAKATETLQTMGAALRLGKVREKRAISAMEALQKKCTEQEVQQRQQMQETRMDVSEIQPALLSALTAQAASTMEQHHSGLSECMLACHLLHAIVHGRFMGQKTEEAMRALDVGWKVIEAESLLEAADHLARSMEIAEETLRTHVASATSAALTVSGIDFPVFKKSEGGGCRGCLTDPAKLDMDKRLRLLREVVADDNGEAAVESEDEDSLRSGSSLKRELRSFERCTECSQPQMVDAATITVSPVQISLAVGCSLPTSPHRPNKGTETISPILISLAVGTSPRDDGGEHLSPNGLGGGCTTKRAA